jgi:hypothetical protein
MEAFASLLEDRLLETIHLQGLINEVNAYETVTYPKSFPKERTYSMH